MMQFLSRYKTVLIIAGIAVLLGGAFMLLSQGSDNAGASVTLSVTVQQQLEQSEQIERELIQELAKLRTIRLHDSIFASEEFASLVDFSRRIDERPRGRQNPFAPF